MCNDLNHFETESFKIALESFYGKSKKREPKFRNEIVENNGGKQVLL